MQSGGLAAAGAATGNPYLAVGGLVADQFMGGGGAAADNTPSVATSAISGDVNAQFNPPSYPFSPSNNGFVDLSTITPSTSILLGVAALLVVVLVAGRAKKG